MAVLDIQVSALADDAHEDHTGANFSSVAATLRNDANASGSPNRRFFAGMRFVLPSAIPSGSTIDVAYITVVCPSATQDDPNVDLHAEDVADADDFATTADVTSRARTAASAAWVATSIGTSPVNSPSIVSVIQELIDDSGGLVSGAAIVILSIARGDFTSNFRYTSYDGTPADAVSLRIEYTAGGGGGSNPHYYQQLIGQV